MGKIIQFSLPDVAKWQLIGPETPVKRDNPPPRRQKEPALDQRAYLERPGYILIGLHIFWTFGRDGTPFDRACNVYWMPKTGPRWVHYGISTMADALYCSPFYRTSRVKVTAWLNHHNTDHAVLFAPGLLEYGPDPRPAYFENKAPCKQSKAGVSG